MAFRKQVDLRWIYTQSLQQILNLFFLSYHYVINTIHKLQSFDSFYGSMGFNAALGDLFGKT